MLNYVVDVGESENYDEFLKIIINQTTDEFKEETMTIAEQLENRGFQKGEHAKAIAIAENLMLQGVDFKIVKFATSLSDEDLARIFKVRNS